MATDAVEYNEDYPERFLECRVRHSWVKIGYFRAEGLIVRAEYCDSCTMHKHSRWSTGGSRYPTRYFRPDGYAVQGGLKPWEVRMSLLKRATIHDSADALTEATGKAIK